MGDNDNAETAENWAKLAQQWISEKQRAEQYAQEMADNPYPQPRPPFGQYGSFFNTPRGPPPMRLPPPGMPPRGAFPMGPPGGPFRGGPPMGGPPPRHFIPPPQNFGPQFYPPHRPFRPPMMGRPPMGPPMDMGPPPMWDQMVPPVHNIPQPRAPVLPQPQQQTAPPKPLFQSHAHVTPKLSQKTPSNTNGERIPTPPEAESNIPSGIMGHWLADYGEVVDPNWPQGETENKKALPQWLVDGLEQAEKEKQQKIDEEKAKEESMNKDAEKEQRLQAKGLSKFDSDSEDEETETTKEITGHSVRLTIEECDQNAIIAKKRLITMVLLDSSDRALNRQLKIYVERNRIEPKAEIIANSAALSTLASYSGDEDSEEEETNAETTHLDHRLADKFMSNSANADLTSPSHGRDSGDRERKHSSESDRRNSEKNSSHKSRKERRRSRSPLSERSHKRHRRDSTHHSQRSSRESPTKDRHQTSSDVSSGEGTPRVRKFTERRSDDRQ